MGPLRRRLGPPGTDIAPTAFAAPETLRIFMRFGCIFLTTICQPLTYPPYVRPDHWGPMTRPFRGGWTACGGPEL
jgi:hypothetical protein